MKKAYKLGIIALMSFIGLSSASAQSPLRFGVEAGVNLSNASTDDEAGVDKKAIVGFQVGVTGEYALTESFYLQSGLSFTTKGTKLEEKDADFSDETTITLSYLQLPVYAAYKIAVTPGTKIVFNAGPYLAYGVSGKYKFKNSGEIPGDYDPFKEYDGDKADLKRFDFGLGFGAGAEFGKIVVSLRYELGLTNLSNDDDYDYKNLNAALTVGYKF